jgi:N-acetyl-gamma-glutamyl-phosphate reductase
MREKIKIGIVGGAGFAAGELIRLTLQHPNATIQFINSASHNGQKVSQVHPDLEGECDLIFTDSWDDDVDLMFLCKGHGQSSQFLEENRIPKRIKIIDLSSDFRLKGNNKKSERSFIYGLPELNREKIRNSDSVANPGCFATTIELALLPIVSECHNDVHINSITGSTGAGQSLSVTSLFSWRDNNISTYKVFEYQHLDEVRETLQEMHATFDSELYFVPIRGNYPRGIFSTLYTKTDLTGEEIQSKYRSFYNGQPFIRINGSDVYLKKVINTNNVFISIKKHDDMVFIECIIDNLMKGASGQAVQNMNIMFGVDETAGLKMKASAY